MRGKPFPKGCIPWNKGKRGLQTSWNKGTKGICKPNSGSFKKGHKSWMKGRKLSKECIEKLRKTNIGRIPWNKGKKLSKEHIEKLRKAKLGKIGKKANHWKGGKIREKRGYIRILFKTHPFADSQGYVFEHRLIIEGKIGRYLQPIEVIHHINNIAKDNRIKNLILCKNNAEHRHLHKLSSN